MPLNKETKPNHSISNNSGGTSTVFVYTQLNIKTVLFQTIQFSISTQFKCKKNRSIYNNSVWH